jgi:hypothetical protein
MRVCWPCITAEPVLLAETSDQIPRLQLPALGEIERNDRSGWVSCCCFIVAGNNACVSSMSKILFQLNEVLAGTVWHPRHSGKSLIVWINYLMQLSNFDLQDRVNA